MQPKITGADTWTHFIGSGALSYSWYNVQSCTEYATVEAMPGNWLLAFTDGEEPDDDRVYVIDHAAVMVAVRSLARAYPDHWDCAGADSSDLPFGACHETMRQCALFLADPEYADFDAGTADEVLQVAAFGKAIYG